VHRYNVEPFFKELARDPIYVDEDDVERGRLRGAIETPHRAWWISAIQRQRINWHRDIQFRIWEALLWWMAKIARLAETAIASIPAGPIEVFLRFEKLESWTSERIDDLPASQEVDFRVNRWLVAIQLALPLGFLRHFATPANIAERKLIRACFAGIAVLGGARLDSAALDDLVRGVVRNDEARFFHLTFAQTYRQQINAAQLPEPRFRSEGEINFVCIGLAQRILKRHDSAPVEGVVASNHFLHAVVDECWRELQILFEKLDRRSVIERALANVEAIERDKQRWRMTASALLATHDDRELVVEAAAQREQDRAAAELASRIVVEMAVCACSATGGALISEADLDRLLALVILLLEAAYSSDAVQYSLTPAKVNVFPNGEFVVDGSYFDTVMRPYMAEHFTEQFTAAASSYGNYYRDPKASGDGAETGSFVPTFVEAFQAEFGFTPDDLISANVALEADALRDNKLIVQRTEQAAPRNCRSRCYRQPYA